MTKEIPQTEWSHFFDDLSSEKPARQISVQVLNEETGSQILADGVALAGITAEKRGDASRIEIMLGNSPDNHQTHTIFEPQKIYFRREDNSSRTIVEIEDNSGTKTLVYITQPK